MVSGVLVVLKVCAVIVVGFAALYPTYISTSRVLFDARFVSVWFASLLVGWFTLRSRKRRGHGLVICGVPGQTLHY